MTTISYLSEEDLEKLPYCIKYFFEGENGFYERKGLPRYNDFGIKECLKANDVFENSTEKDFSDLCRYIGDKRQSIIKQIEKLQKEIESNKNSLQELYLIGQTIKTNNNFKENIDLMIKITTP